MVTITIKNVAPNFTNASKSRQRTTTVVSMARYCPSWSRRSLSLPLLSKATLERTRKFRELTAHYVITNKELTKWKNEGHE